MKARRFFFVRSVRSNVAHRYYGKSFVEGEKLACGRRIGYPGWTWWKPWESPRHTRRQRVCKGCEAAA